MIRPRGKHIAYTRYVHVMISPLKRELPQRFGNFSSSTQRDEPATAERTCLPRDVGTSSSTKARLAMALLHHNTLTTFILSQSDLATIFKALVQVIRPFYTALANHQFNK